MQPINKQYTPMLVGALCFLLPAMATAHTGFMTHHNGIMAGLTHPMTGIDHLLVMLAVGLWAAQMGGRALWAVPVTFVSIMLVGALLGMYGFALPQVEMGILLSVFVSGALILAAYQAPIWLSISIVALFAVFHGDAHGSEMLLTVNAATYSLGFIFTTALLHSIGILFGMGLQKLEFAQLQRWAGGAIVLSGVYLAVA